MGQRQDTGYGSLSSVQTVARTNAMSASLTRPPGTVKWTPFSLTRRSKDSAVCCPPGNGRCSSIRKARSM